MTDIATERARRPQPQTTGGDSDQHAHIVMRGDQLRGYVAGEPIEALCGKVWVPSRDYEGRPVCQACLDERERLLAGMKGRN